jgi:phosphoribosylformylglycinamidine (FGAM) synthase-like amidotransferase family enzyme
MNSLSIIFEAAVSVSAFATFVWVVLIHLKKPSVKDASCDLTNVVSITNGKQAQLEKNLQEFLDAENALTRNETEKYMALRMQALENAKKNLSYRRSEEKRVS